MPYNRPQYIVLHHSASRDHVYEDFEAIRRGHLARGWRDIGYHAVVETGPEGPTVRFGRMPWDPGAHCPGCNDRSIGVCTVGNYEETPFPEGLLAPLADLVRSYMTVFRIPVANVRPHRDFKATLCPGKFFPLDEIRERVAG